MKRTRLICAILTVLMLFSLTACGEGGQETKDPNLLSVGDFGIAL